MSAQAYLWIKAIHQLGFVLWVGSMFALTLVLYGHARAAAAAPGALVGIERSLGRAMEIGALLAIVCGALIMLLWSGPANPIRQPWMHIKLTLAAALLALHGVTRARMARLGRGQSSGPAGWLSGAVLVVALAMIVLATVQPMSRM